MKHGNNFKPPPVTAMLEEDPDMWLVTADMRAWSEAHPCNCEAICKCDEQKCN